MPARQRGSVEKLATCWGVRFVDEGGIRRRQSGFATKTQARAWVDAKVDEVEALRRGDCVTRAQESLTLSEAIARFLAQHDVDVATTNKLTRQLRQAESTFGNRLLESLRPDELAAWRRSLPQGSRHDVFRALKQVLGQAAQWGWVDASPAAFIKNPKPKRPEIDPFESWDEIYAIDQCATVIALRSDLRGLMTRAAGGPRSRAGPRVRLAAITSVASGPPARYLVDECFLVRLVPRARV
jgi:hypothetical protein